MFDVARGPWTIWTISAWNLEANALPQKKKDAKFKCCSVASNVLHNTTTSCLALLLIILSSSETPGAYNKKAFEWLGLKTDESWCNQDQTKWNTAPNPFLRLQIQSNTLTCHLAAKLCHEVFTSIQKRPTCRILDNVLIEINVPPWTSSGDILHQTAMA